MPLLDVSDVLDDPMFRDDSLTVTRKASAVDADGFNVSTPVTRPFSAVVTAVNGDELRILPDGTKVSGSIMVITRERLIPGAIGREGDIVTYTGSQYKVVGVDNYERYGAGFVQATCELLPVSGGPL